MGPLFRLSRLFQFNYRRLMSSWLCNFDNSTEVRCRTVGQKSAAGTGTSPRMAKAAKRSGASIHCYHLEFE